jgi:hypothetical protein
MLQKFLLSYFILLAFQQVKAQQYFSVLNTDSLVEEIKTQTLKKGESMFIEIADFAAGVAIPFTYKKETIKVERILQLPYGNWQTNYYFKNGKLVLIEDMEETFLINEYGELDYSVKEKNYYARFYFLNDKLVERIENGEKRNAEERFFNAEMELIQAKLYASEL